MSHIFLQLGRHNRPTCVDLVGEGVPAVLQEHVQGLRLLRDPKVEKEAQLLRLQVGGSKMWQF